jgi:hypothetical protein
MVSGTLESRAIKYVVYTQRAREKVGVEVDSLQPRATAHGGRG